ncbi:MAG TPA: universal stress protein [Candidatus Omnitrophota bacterium]|nr:universal stress protein [Candidatus Omnitrophota bacterium]
MYKNILVPLENSKNDKIILNHIRPLAKMLKAHLFLVHVADGYAARLQETLNLDDSEEIKKDRAYLEAQMTALKKEGFDVETYLAAGEPAKRILEIAHEKQCDLIAMATHGHRFLQDLFLGSVAEELRHKTSIPILMLRVAKN